MRPFRRLWLSMVGLSSVAFALSGCGGDADTDVGGNAPALCGNARLDEGEHCDDGNEIDDDQCDNECHVGPGSAGSAGGSSRGGNTGNAGSTGSSGDTGAGGDSGSDSCGDGVVQSGEACDDGNTSSSDACTNLCEGAACGDGHVQTGEACDDGNDDDADACTTECQGPACGDAVVDDDEECDDGNEIDDDECRNNCRDAACGDGVLQEGEECDDANTSDADLCTAECLEPICGDGIAQPGEACDDGNDDEDTCTSDCALPTCGDEIVQAGEDCDDGNADEEDCTDRCLVPACGDGVVQEGEECDDFNGSNADECTNDCAAATCGDGYTQPGEDCDDGAQNGAGGSCTASCGTAPVDDDPCDDGDVRCFDGDAQVCAGDEWDTLEQCDVCEDGRCVFLCDGVDANDDNVCTDDSCDPVTGSPVHTPANVGGRCDFDDEGVCNGTDVCDASGACVAGDTAPEIDDANDCTVDSCDPVSGAVHAAQTATACDDGDACTEQDTCDDGACTGGSPVVCQALDACHVAGVCDSETGLCSNPNADDGTECANDTVCDGDETCDVGECVPGDALVVDDGNACTVDSCDPVLGVANDFVNEGTSCADADPCNGAEICDDSGQCQDGADLDPDDFNACTIDSCVPGEGPHYENRNAGFDCADANECDGDEVCDDDGTCIDAPDAGVDDGNPCTVDACSEEEGVTHVPFSGAAAGCGDDDVCTGDEVCVAGTCDESIDDLELDDENPCTADACDPVSGVTHAPLDGVSCSDGDACNGAEMCDAGVCQPGTPLAASPSITSLGTQSFATNVQTHNVTMPSMSAGDLVLVLFVNNNGNTTVSASGWTQLFTNANSTGMRLSAFARIGSFSSPQDFFTSSSETAAAHVYRIAAASWWGSIAEGVAQANADSPGPDIEPPNLTPAWGAANNLWFAVAGHDDDDLLGGGTPSSPAGYTNLVNGAPSYTRTESGGSQEVTLLSAFRTLNAASENPGDYDILDHEEAVGATIAIRGVCGGQ